MSVGTRNQTSIEGALYDLVCRGVKDNYFIKDDKDSAHPFNWSYDRYPAELPETRLTNPLNQPRFGQRCEFEFDFPGDVLQEASLVIELPTWLPPEMVANNYTTDTYVAGTPNTYYGYVNGVGFFLFDSIQIYQDSILLQDLTGDALYAMQLTKQNINQGFLTQQLAGIHDGSNLSIMRNAVPGRLEIPLPMIGCTWPGDRGLPLAGLRDQPFRLRLSLRPLERIVESSNPAEYNPAPWTKPFTQGSIVAPAVTRDSIGQVNIWLKTKQLYLLNEAKDQLATETVEVPYLRYFVNTFGANQLDYAPLAKGGTANLIKFIDATFTVERVVSFFRNSTNIMRNRLWDFSNDLAQDGQFYSSLQLVIAGQLREGPWPPELWQNIVVDAKEERSSSRTLATMDWSRGWRIEDTPPANREPTGGINFTTADRPMLTFALTDITPNPVLGYKQSYLFSICESWALYKIEKGRGRLLYYN